MSTSPLRRIGHPIRVRSARVDRWITHAEQRRELAGDPIVILSLGKTGTTSLERALKLATGRRVAKGHVASREGLDARIAKEAALAIVPRPHFWWRNEAIATALRGAAPSGRWDVLTGVRDPVALAVSDRFYGRKLQVEAGLDVDAADLDEHGAAIESTLTRLFLDDDWFRSEFEPATGIDVYAQPHPIGAAAVRESDRCRALVLRFEDLATVAPAACQAFLGLDAPLLVEHGNRGDGDRDGSDYSRFLATPVLDPAVVEAVYDAPLARHFYDDAERAAMRDRWIGVRR